MGDISGEWGCRPDCIHCSLGRLGMLDYSHRPGYLSTAEGAAYLALMNCILLGHWLGDMRMGYSSLRSERGLASLRCCDGLLERFGGQLSGFHESLQSLMDLSL